MNNTFNVNRFLLLFKKHSLEHAKTYLMSIAVLAGVLFLSLGFFAYSNDGRLNFGVQATVMLYCLIGAGVIFASLSFTELGDKRKAAGLLTLPASHFEKYLVTWLYTFIIFQLVFFGMFYLVDYIVISLCTPPPAVTNTLLNVFTISDEPAMTFISYAIAHAFAFWGAVYFEKMHLIKTLFVFFLILIALVIINKPLLHLIVGSYVEQSPPFSPAEFSDSTGNKWRVLPDNVVANFGIVIIYILILFTWASTFFRLKEKEI